MSLPKALEAKAWTLPGTKDALRAVMVSDLEAWLYGELTQCPTCGGTGVAISPIPHACHCDQGQVRGPGLVERVKERAEATQASRYTPTFGMVLEALRIELNSSPTSEPDREGT